MNPNGTQPWCPNPIVVVSVCCRREIMGTVSAVRAIVGSEVRACTGAKIFKVKCPTSSGLCERVTPFNCGSRIVLKYVVLKEEPSCTLL
jgi:hypothetical protein